MATSLAHGWPSYRVHARNREQADVERLLETALCLATPTANES
jgi:hypothetical protein